MGVLMIKLNDEKTNALSPLPDAVTNPKYSSINIFSFICFFIKNN
jgi:hypothetical protein